MTIKMRNLGRWSAFGGKALVLPGPQSPRRIVIEVNSVTEARYDVESEGEVTFLAACKGRETIEFIGVGDVTFTATSEGEVFYFTNDGEQTAYTRELASFTKIANREARNPHVEAIMWKAHQSELARQATHDQMMADLNRKLAEINAAKGTQGDGTGSVGSGAGAPGAEGDEPAGAAGDAGGEGQPKPASRPKKAAAGVSADGEA